MAPIDLRLLFCGCRSHSPPEPWAGVGLADEERARAPAAGTRRKMIHANSRNHLRAPLGGAVGFIKLAEARARPDNRTLVSTTRRVCRLIYAAATRSFGIRQRGSPLRGKSHRFDNAIAAEWIFARLQQLELTAVALIYIIKDAASIFARRSPPPRDTRYICTLSRYYYKYTSRQLPIIR